MQENVGVGVTESVTRFVRNFNYLEKFKSLFPFLKAYLVFF